MCVALGEPNLLATSSLSLVVDGGLAGTARNGQYLRKAPLSSGGCHWADAPGPPSHGLLGVGFSDSPSCAASLVNCPRAASAGLTVSYWCAPLEDAEGKMVVCLISTGQRESPSQQRKRKHVADALSILKNYERRLSLWEIRINRNSSVPNALNPGRPQSC
jgi:hypothetical protein